MAEDAELDTSSVDTSEADTSVDTDSSTDESTDSDGSQATDQTTDDTETDSDQAEDDSTSSDTETDEGSESDQKAQNRKGYEQRQQQKQERSALDTWKKQVDDYEAQLKEEKRNVDMTDANQRLDYLEKQEQAREARARIQEIQTQRTSIAAEDARAKAELPVFDPKTDAGRANYEDALQLFAENYLVTDDETGEVLGAYDRKGNPVSLYQFLSKEAQRIERLSTRYTRQGQQNQAKMQNRTITPPGASPKKGSGDSIEELEARIGDYKFVQ